MIMIQIVSQDGSGETGKQRNGENYSLIHRFTHLLILSALLLTIVSGCIAIVPEDDPVKKDVNNLRQDTTVQQQRLASLEEAIKKELEFQTKKLESIEGGSQKDKANVRASLDKIREDMAFLNGKLGEAEAAVKKAGEDTAVLREKNVDKKEIDSRLTVVQNQIAALEKRLASLDERLAVLEHPKPSPVAIEETPKEVNKKEVESPKPDELYNEAIQRAKNKDYAEAIEKFTKFISLFPGNDLAQNAQYWIGEMYYAQKDYERAVLEFNEVIKKYPKGKKAPGALLKQGMAFYEMGDKKEARLILEKVIDKYPKTEEANTAKKTLRKIK
ncbi:MAG: tol-pal system protein YbgF [Deltaproteobacteria bacterium]|nr:tol-pal system protein YbgF [Deltaproteobacteria bacterium]